VPGGFSFGDELGSGKILALKLRHGVGGALSSYVDAGGAVLGICNGFQVLTRLGVFGSDVVLTQNEGGHFINQWVGLEVAGRNIFTERLRRAGVSRLELPMRHGEGRLVIAGAQAQLAAGVEVAFRYEQNVNGAWERVAGLSSHRGRVVGLMPHPEAFWAEELHPWGPGRPVPLGLELFRSACEEVGGKK
jgi:phosphoribosylformylglycinamidine synthase